MFAGERAPAPRTVQAAPSVCPHPAGAGKMEAVIEKECSALGGLFQTIISDMKGSYPVWEDFINKAGKLQSQLRTTVVAAAAFLDAFQKVADMATNTRGKQMEGWRPA